MSKNILNHLQTVDPILYEVAKDIVIPNLSTSKNYFSSLCDAIISQQLSEKAGTTIWLRFKKLFPNEEVTPEYLVSIPHETIRSIGPSNAKINFMKDLAEKVLAKEVHLEKLEMMTDQEVIDELTKVKGIGPWTAEMFLIFTLGREDVFSCGDLGLKRAIQRIYKLDYEPTKEELERISAKWSPYRSHVCRILWKSLSIK